MSIFKQIKDRYGILDYLVEKGLPFKPIGKRQVLNCPLPGHSDNNASFNVYTDADDYRIKCYGCGFSGDLFDFVGKMEGKTVWEVVQDFALNFGLSPASGSNEEKELKNFQEVHQLVLAAEDTCVRAQNWLQGHEEALGYLRDTRGFSNDSIALWRLGWDNTKKCITLPLMDKSRRVMCFVEHYFGQYLGNSGGKKYVVPSNDISIAKLGKYKKSAYFHGLWNLDLAQDNTVWLVEGYFDVVAMHQLGYTNCLAITTALMTQDQVQELYRLTNSSTNLIFVPDGDVPGFNSVVANIEHFKNIAANKYRGVQVINVSEDPSIKDANDWLVKNGGILPEPFCSELYQALKVCNAVSNQEIKLWQLRQIAENASPIARLELARYFADDLQIPVELLAAQLEVADIQLDESYGAPIGDVEIVRQYVKECLEHGIAAGFGERINNLLLGFRPGALVGLAGRSNTGKTTIACDYLWNQMEQGSRPTTIFFSVEMRKPEIMLKLHRQATSHVDAELFALYAEDPTFVPWTDDPFKHVYIWDQPAMSVEEIERVVKRIESTYFNGPIQQIIIDHAQLLVNNEKNSYERVTAVAKDLMSFAKRTKIVTLVLLQTSRNSGKSGGVELNMDSTRDSGAMEEVLDVMFTIWRPFYSMSVDEQLKQRQLEASDPSLDHRQECVICLKIAKSRWGGREETVTAYMLPDSLRIRYDDPNDISEEVHEMVETEKLFANTGN